MGLWQVLKATPFLMGSVLIVAGMSIWATECSNPSPGAFDTVCFTYNPYGWLTVIGIGVVATWAFGILLRETKPLTGLRGFWRAHVSQRPRTAVLLTTLSFGLLGILARWINGWPPYYQPFYPENFLEHYVTWFSIAAVAGFAFAVLMNLDSSRKTHVPGHP